MTFFIWIKSNTREKVFMLTALIGELISNKILRNESHSSLGYTVARGKSN